MKWIALGCTFALTVAGCGGDAGSGNLEPPPPPVIKLSKPAESGDGQSAGITTTLLRPLRVIVDSGGVPRSGVTVTWHSDYGHLTPAVGLTDATGLATTSWTFDTTGGVLEATAVVDGAEGSPAWFSATAVPGPPTGFEKTSGDTETVAVNHQPIFPLIARLVDRYHNAVGGRTVIWSVPRGPFTLDTNTGTTDANGFTTATLGRRGTEGTGTARVALDDGAFPATFVLTVGPAEGFAIALWGNDTYTYFQSVQNGTRRPAVDTIPLGATVEWRYLNHDYGQHRVTSVGAPSFAVAPPKGLGPQFHASSTFTTAGTYHYDDFYFPTATGEIVVR